MKKVTRTLEQIRTDISTHKAAIKELEQEVKDFQSACPHPENFKKVDRKTSQDEYGATDGYLVTTTCLLCGHSEHKTEEAGRSRYL
jgi:hypothetical protein